MNLKPDFQPNRTLSFEKMMFNETEAKVISKLKNQILKNSIKNTVVTYYCTHEIYLLLECQVVTYYCTHSMLQ